MKKNKGPKTKTQRQLIAIWAHLGGATLLALVGAWLKGAGAGGSVNQIFGALMAPVVLVLTLGALLWFATRKKQGTRKRMFGHAKRVAKHHIFQTVAVSWFGLGLAIAGMVEVVDWLTSRHLPANVFSHVLAGPLSIRDQGMHPGLAIALLAAWVIFWLMVVRQVRRGELKVQIPDDHPLAGIKNAVSKEKAPDKKPEGADFAHVVAGLERVVDRAELPANKILLGQAELADDWGQPKKKVWITLPDEGSALIIGASGSGKASPLVNTLLASKAPAADSKERPVKWVIASTKVSDLAGPTVAYLRTQGTVQMLDISCHAEELSADGLDLGDQVRTSPLVHVTDHATSQQEAKRLVETVMSAREREANQFWASQMTILIGAALLAATLLGKDYGDALRLAQSFSDGDDTTVEDILRARGFDDSLRGWEVARKTLLARVEQQDGTVRWEEKRTADSTGVNIQSTLSSLMVGLDRPKARMATANPNFDSHEWLKAPGQAYLFLVGDAFETEATQALLAPFLHDLLVEGQSMAQASPEGRLSYDLKLLLDEMPNLCPVPDLDKHYSLTRSSGIQIVGVAQALPQLQRLYGREVMQTLLVNSQVLMFTNGMVDDDTIRMLGSLAGSKLRKSTSRSNGDGRSSETISDVAAALIDGQFLRDISRPEPAKRKPAGGLVVTPGGLLKLKMPLWSLHPVLTYRGTPSSNPEHRAIHDAYLKDLESRPGLRFKRFVGSLAGRVAERTAPTPRPAAPTPAPKTDTEASGDGDHKEAPPTEPTQEAAPSTSPASNGPSASSVEEDYPWDAWDEDGQAGAPQVSSTTPPKPAAAPKSVDGLSPLQGTARDVRQAEAIRARMWPKFRRLEQISLARVTSAKAWIDADKNDDGFNRLLAIAENAA